MRTLQSQIGWCARAQWGLATALVLFAAGFYLFGYRPATRKLDDLQGQIGTMRHELSTAKARAEQLPVVELAVEKLQLKLDRFNKKLPKSLDLGQFLGEITQISKQLSLRNWDYKLADGPQRRELFAEQPINLKFQGDFPNVVSFLRQTEDMQRLTRVRKLQVKARDEKLGQVEVDLSMNIYFSEG